MNAYMAIDQYGQTFHDLKHPRKDLMDRLGCQHADKLYIDKADGSIVSAGYVIAGLWLTVYKVTRIDKPA